MLRLVSSILKTWFILLKLLFSYVAHMVMHPGQIRITPLTDRQRETGLPHKPHNRLNPMDPRNIMRPDNPTSIANPMSLSSPAYEDYRRETSWND